MLASKTYRLIGLIFNSCSKVSAIPFRWDRKRLIFKDCKKTCQRFKFNCLLVLIWWLYTLYQSFHLRHAAKTSTFNLLAIFNIAGVLILQAFYILLVTRKDILRTANLGFLYLNRMNKIYMPSYNPNGAKDARVVHFLLQLSVCIFFLSTALLQILVMVYPNGKTFFMCLVPENYRMIRFTLQLLTHFQCIIVHMSLSALCIIMILYFFVIHPFVVREFDMTRRDHRCLKHFKNYFQFIKMYRTFQVFHQVMLGTFGVHLPICQAACTQLPIFCIYKLIRHFRRLSFTTICALVTWFTGASLFQSVLLDLSGRLFASDLKVKESWKRHNWGTRWRCKLMLKFRKSCKPMMINYGKMYIIKQLSILKYYRGVSRGIFRTLLLAKKK